MNAVKTTKIIRGKFSDTSKGMKGNFTGWDVNNTMVHIPLAMMEKAKMGTDALANKEPFFVTYVKDSWDIVTDEVDADSADGFVHNVGERNLVTAIEATEDAIDEFALDGANTYIRQLNKKMKAMNDLGLSIETQNTLIADGTLV